MPGLILVIDDEEIIRMTSEEILRELGYDVLTAACGDEGISILRGKGDAVSLVLLDMSMPGKSGRETYSEIKELIPSMKVLIASGYMNDNTFQIDRGGNDGFIQKPYTLSELSGKLSEILQH